MQNLRKGIPLTTDALAQYALVLRLLVHRSRGKRRGQDYWFELASALQTRPLLHMQRNLWGKSEMCNVKLLRKDASYLRQRRTKYTHSDSGWNENDIL